MTDKFTRTSNVLVFRSSLDRIATLSGPDQAQRACDEAVSAALNLDAAIDDMIEQYPKTLKYLAPESDGA